MDRISLLKPIALSNSENPNRMLEQKYWYHKAYMDTCGERFHNIRRAKMDCIFYDNYSIEITPNELIAGRFSNNFTLTPEQEKELDRAVEAVKYGGSMSGHLLSMTGHRVLDYEKMLNRGIRYIIGEIDTKLEKIDYSQPGHAEKAVFYKAAKITLEGFCRFAVRHSETLQNLAANEPDPRLKAEYKMMANNFSKAPYEPCTTFYEALQCMWLLQHTMNLFSDPSLTGRFDNYMYPFYKKDIENGTIDKDFAYKLIENLYLKHNEIYGTWPAALMVGGVDKQGNPVWNELSEMCIDAIETTGLINPSVAVAYTEDMPEALLDKCIRIIGKGYTKPSLFNDRVVRQGLEDAGMDPSDARYYIHSTCVEITPVASSNIMVTAPYINPCKALEYVLGDKQKIYGAECGIERDIQISEEDISTFEGFYKKVKTALTEIIRVCLVNDCNIALERKRYQSSPLASAFLDDCIERGLDASASGAKYNYFYPCFPGFVTLVDSLQAVKTAKKMLLFTPGQYVALTPAHSALFRFGCASVRKLARSTVHGCACQG